MNACGNMSAWQALAVERKEAGGQPPASDYF